MMPLYPFQVSIQPLLPFTLYRALPQLHILYPPKGGEAIFYAGWSVRLEERGIPVS